MLDMKLDQMWMLCRRYNSLKGEMDQLREVYRNLTDDNHKIKTMYEAKCEELSKVRVVFYMYVCLPTTIPWLFESGLFVEQSLGFTC